MNEDKASPAVRWLIRAALAGAGAGDSLGNVNTQGFPNGASCFVIAEQAVWVLSKFSTTGTVAGSSLAGMGGGTWFLQSSSAALAGGVEVTSTNFDSFAVDTNWNQTTTTNSAMTGTPASWAYTAAGGILTYSGPTRDFAVVLMSSARVGNADSARVAFLGISKNNDLTGAPSVGGPNLTTAITAINIDFALGSVRKVTLTAGDTLRAKMATAAASVSLQACRRMVVTPA